MAQLALLAVTLCVAAALAAAFRQGLARTLAAALCVLMAVMYLFGVAGLLRYGMWAVLALAAGCLGFTVWRCVKDKTILRKYLLTPALWVFCGLCLLLAWWGARGRMLMEHDEFSHWGRVVKAMWLNGQLGNHGFGVIFTHYPPGTALLQYLACSLGGAYAEGTLIGAQNLFCLALMMPPLAALRGPRARLAVPVAAYLLALPLLFYPTVYQSLYVDPVLGLLFGAVLYGWFSEGEKTLFTFLNGGLLLFAMALVKDSGAGLGAIALGIIAVDMLLAAKRKERVCAYWPMGLAGLAGGLLLGRYSWKLYLALTTPEAAQKGGFGDNLAALGDLAALRAEPYKYTTLQNFVTRFFDEALVEHLIPLTSFMLLALFALAVGWLSCRRRGLAGARRLAVLGWGLLAGCAAYLLSMLYMYVVLFNEYEAVPLHSYARYLGSYVLGMLYAFPLVAARLRVEDGREAGKGGTLRAWAMALCVLVFARPGPLANVTLLAPLTARESRTINEMYAGPAARAAPALAGQSGRTVVVVPAGDTYITQAFSYHFLPYDVSFVQMDEDGGLSAHGEALSPAQWLARLEESGAPLVYLFAGSDAFAAQYGEVFFDGAPKQGAFYRVLEENGSLGLALENI